MSPARKIAAFFIIAGCFTFQNAMAQDYPILGLLYSDEDDHAITYHCTTNNATLTCDLVQMVVGEIEQPLNQSIKSFSAGRQVPATSISPPDESVRKTCRVSAHAFTQSFAWNADYEGGKGAWVAIARPEGTCGVRQMSRFETDGTMNGLIFWKYVAQRAVTKPNDTILGRQCGQMLDQHEHDYSWMNQRTSRLSCEFIEFSPS